MIYSVFAMVALMGLASLAVDLGRAQLAKSELQTAADAAARAATAYLPSDAAGAQLAAITVAAQQTVDGSTLVVLPTDVSIGKWDPATKTMDTASAYPDAVRVTACRTTARGNPFAMTLAKTVGFTKMDLTVAATATANVTSNFGIVGLTALAAPAGAVTGTYDSSTGVYTTGSASHQGSIASNVAMVLGADASIGGFVYYNTVSATVGASYTEGKVKLPGSIPTPAQPAAGSYLTSNSNAYMGLPTTGAIAVGTGPGTTSVAGGNYVLTSLNISNMTLAFNGPTTLWMYGPATITNASFLAYQGKPSNLQIKFCAPTAMAVSAGGTVQGVITAPTSTVALTGGARIVGSVVAGGLSVTSSSIYYDAQLGPNGIGVSTGSTMVK